MAKREGSFKGFWIGLISFLVAAALVIGALGIGTTGFKDWSFSRWFPKKGAEQHEVSEGNTVISGEESYGIALASMQIPESEYAAYSVDRAVQNAYSVTASFVPENTTFQEVDYSLYFDTTSKPEYATWAQGKNMEQYASVTQDETDSRKATVTFKSAFSAPIMIKAASRRDGGIYATIRADYVCRSFAFPSKNRAFPEVDVTNFEEGEQVTWSNGTIIPSAQDSKIIYKYDFGDYWVTKMAEKGYTVEQYYEYTFKFDDEWQLTEEHPCLKTMLMEMGGAAATANPDEYWGAVCVYMLGGQKPENLYNSGIASNGYGVSRVYNGVIYSDYTADIETDGDIELVEWGGFEIHATSMGVTEDGGSSSIVMG